MSSKFTVIGDWVDGFMVGESASSLVEFVLFALRGKTFNDSSVRCSLDTVVTSISGDNDDDVAAGWYDEYEGTLAFDCNDNVVFSEAGVGRVVTARRKNKARDETKRKSTRC